MLHWTEPYRHSLSSSSPSRRSPGSYGMFDGLLLVADRAMRRALARCRGPQRRAERAPVLAGDRPAAAGVPSGHDRGLRRGRRRALAALARPADRARGSPASASCSSRRSLAEAFPVPVENLPAGHVSLAAIFIVGDGADLRLARGGHRRLPDPRACSRCCQRRPLVRLLYNARSTRSPPPRPALATAARSRQHEPVSGCSLLEVIVAADRVLRRQHPARRGDHGALVAPAVPADPARLGRRGRRASFAIMASVSLALKVLWTQSPALDGRARGPARRGRAPPALDPQRAARDAARAHRPADRPRQPPRTSRSSSSSRSSTRPRPTRRSASASSTSTTSSRSTTATAIPPATGCSRRSRARLRQAGNAFRLGGDEFALILPGVRREGARSRTPSGSSRRSAPTTPSTAAPSASRPASRRSRSTARDRSELVRVADISLYWAKAEGKNRVRLYEPDRPVAQHLAGARDRASTAARASAPRSRSPARSTRATRTSAATPSASASSRPRARRASGCRRSRSS